VRAVASLDESAAHRALLQRAARSLGVGTDDDLADYHRLRVSEMRPLLRELVAEGALGQVEVDGWDRPAYLDPAAMLPRRVRACALVSPFDSLVWYRPRVERLFGFRYRIEIYVPAAQRRFGYYVLPFLLGDRLVGRVDLKADRAGGRLLVQTAWHEPGEDRGRVAGALGAALDELAGWLGLDDVAVRRRGNLADALVAAPARGVLADDSG
jgi:uncharacterized protein